MAHRRFPMRRARARHVTAGVVGALSSFVAFVGTPTAAAFIEETGRWTVLALRGSCLALNRPPVEFSARPINALVLHRSMAGDVRLQVFFWPGLVTAGETITLLLAVPGAGIVELPSVAIDDTGVETEAPLSRELIETVSNSDQIVVAAGPTAPSLTFAVVGLSRVLERLDACGDTLG